MATYSTTATQMTLTGIAYGDPGSIALYLDESPVTRDAWSVAWLASPPDPPVNFAYLACDKSADAAVLAIRGTYPNPFSPAYWDDGDQDSPFGDMADWPGAPGARISAGTAKGLAGLLALNDASGVSLEKAVADLPPKTVLTVTGHSLGGTLAPVLALHLADKFPERSIEVVSFAGMTPGNKSFAELFDPGTRLGGKVSRVYNRLDTVAYGWDRVFATHDFYEPAPKGGLAVSALLLATAARLDLGGYDFTPIGEPMVLKGQVQPPCIPCDLIAYVLETLYQHMPDTYLQLLDAPPLPFSILFGSVVVPRTNPKAAASLGHQLPVFYVDPPGVPRS